MPDTTEHTAYLRERRRLYARAWRAKNKDKVREYDNKRSLEQREVRRDRERKRYALKLSRERRGETPEGRQNELQTLAGRPKPDICDVCGRGGLIVYDHCHQQGHFRGWLCHMCNATLGFVADDPEILLKLANYLRQNANKGAQPALPGI